MQDFANAVNSILGLNVNELEIHHMAVRAVIVYILAVVMVRLGEKRFLGKSTAFDVILGIILGSVVSRAITSPSEFFPTLAAGFVLVILHWLFAFIAFRSDRFGDLIKGKSRILIENKEILWDAMQESHVTKKDLLSALRVGINSDNIADVQEARLERNGDISVIKSNSKTKIIEIEVAEGIQTVRLLID